MVMAGAPRAPSFCLESLDQAFRRLGVGLSLEAWKQWTGYLCYVLVKEEQAVAL